VDQVAQWTPEDRAALFQETASRMGLAPAIIEKDFWVCWSLSRLFAAPMRRPALLFKGGTSLSKAYGAIQRFSEDIDLSLDRHDLGFTAERDPENATSRKAAARLLKDLHRACTRYLVDELVPATIGEFERVLGPVGTSWSLEPEPEDPQTILFTYPSSLQAGFGGYVRPIVRLEFGARSDLWPATDAEVRPYAAEHFPEVFQSNPTCTVHVLEAKRTFWEKATLLHAEYHRPGVRPGAERISRHYYDLAQLSDTSIYREALADLDLLTRVAEHKDRFFRVGWAHYADARPGTLRLVPHPQLRATLEADYAPMQEMIFGEPPSFASILERLTMVEAEINGRDRVEPRP
jgi:hypothetical protein